MGVAMIGCEVIASFHLDAKMGLVACFSQNITEGVVLCHNITPMRTSDSMKSKGVKHSQGKVHTGMPGMCPYQATIIIII